MCQNIWKELFWFYPPCQCALIYIVYCILYIIYCMLYTIHITPVFFPGLTSEELAKEEPKFQSKQGNKTKDNTKKQNKGQNQTELKPIFQIYLLPPWPWQNLPKNNQSLKLSTTCIRVTQINNQSIKQARKKQIKKNLASLPKRTTKVWSCLQLFKQVEKPFVVTFSFS